MSPLNPFSQLSSADQKDAIDIGVALTLLGSRLPSTGKPLFDYVATEFVSCYRLPHNLGRHVLRDVGHALIGGDWTLTIVKKGDEIVTSFSKEEKPLL